MNMETLEKKASRGKRGQGCVYRHAGSRNWWIKFSVNGRTIQQSAETESRRDALDKLKAEILKHAAGEAPDSRQTTVQKLKDAMMKEWEVRDKNPASVAWAENCWKRLLPYFGAMKAHAVSSAAIRGYVEYRRGMKPPAANGTINRELSCLSSAFTLGFEETPRRVSHKLSFTRLSEPRGRQGFVEQKQYDALAANCQELYMRTMLALAYSFGFRKAELLSLKVSDVDLLAATVRLRTSKNGEPRQVNLTKDTRELLTACCAGKQSDEAVFTRTELSGKRVPVADFRGTWDAVTKAAGCPGLLFHDLRRSAVRNMVRAGIPEVVCMRISGHKTRAVFDRYNIVSARDLADAARKLELSYSLVTVEQAEKPEGEQRATIQ
jgi:integrase